MIINSTTVLDLQQLDFKMATTLQGGGQTASNASINQTQINCSN